jgi:hypothetical protein
MSDAREGGRVHDYCSKQCGNALWARGQVRGKMRIYCVGQRQGAQKAMLRRGVDHGEGDGGRG